MLDLVFKLASLITVHSRPVPSRELAALLPWREDVKAWLRDGVFDLESPDYLWQHNPEYRITFNTFSLAIFSFILLHEVGHFHNLHAARREERCAQQQVNWQPIERSWSSMHERSSRIRKRSSS
jgi:hypothetical protein